MNNRFSAKLATATLFLLLLSGCTGTTVRYSNVFDKSAGPYTELRLLYLENKLSSTQEMGSPQTNGVLASIGYNDLSYLLAERAPIIFNLNGLAIEVETMKRTELGQMEGQKMISWAEKNGKSPPILVLQIVGGNTITDTQHGSTIIYLNLHANLYNPKTWQRIWTSQFENTLTIAMLGKVGFDNQFTDDMLKQILLQMSKDKLVVIPKGEVITPSYADKPKTDVSPNKAILVNTR